MTLVSPLDREEAAIDPVLRQKVREALDDPSPTIPAEQVFAELRDHHEKRVKALRFVGS